MCLERNVTPPDAQNGTGSTLWVFQSTGDIGKSVPFCSICDMTTFAEACTENSSHKHKQ
ncbi:hypothetical protein BaRGS_00038404, partial [Batillaria attramentaria]